MDQSQVILVDTKDRELGLAEKMDAHRRGLLHRAFSVFVYDIQGRMLLQRRAEDKYHGGGLWSNACCSHPLPGEHLFDAVDRRLSEEMGLEMFTYKALETTYSLAMENGLTEHEYDHVFIGVSNAIPRPNSREVSEWAYVDLAALKADVARRPEAYTPWFRLLLPQVNALLPKILASIVS